MPVADRFVDVGEVLEDAGDVGEDHADRLAALEAAEEDRAVQDDVLAQGLGHQLDVLRFGGAAEGMWLGHRATLPQPLYAREILAPCRATASTRASRLPGSPGPALGRQAQHAALPAQRRPDRRQGRQGAGPAADHHRAQIRPEAHGARSSTCGTASAMVVINTNAGNDKVPAWSLNLAANPEAEVEVGKRKIAGRRPGRRGRGARRPLAQAQRPVRGLRRVRRRSSTASPR